MARSAAISEALAARGARVVALSGDGGESAVRGPLAAAGAELLPFAPAGLARDTDALIDAARRERARAVILDVASLNTYPSEPQDAGVRSLETLRAAGLRVLLVDDLLLLARYPVAVLVNPNLGAESLRYPAPADTCLLLGARYAPVRWAFVEARALVPPVAESVRRVTVLLGGGASAPLAARVLEALAGAAGGLEITVVVGPAGASDAALARAAADAGAACVAAPADLAALLARSDLVVSGGGTTKYELALLGIPAILVPMTDHQIPLTAAFADAGIAADLGPGAFDAARFHARFDAIRGDRRAREAMRARGRAAVDGLGARRIAQAVEEELLGGGDASRG
jgi:spore coat polysaccharide biosynthesis predicted glycosyltransferase SpsG